MSVSHNAQYEPTDVDVWTVLKELPQRVQALLKRHETSRELGFEVFEQELHALFTRAECAATSEALERHDVDLPYVCIDGETHHRAHRCVKTYLCAVGPVSAMRTLYRARSGERAVAAMERRVGIVEGYWTPHAARQGAMLTAHLVPREAEEVLGVLGNMTPSKSSLDRLPKALSARWEAQRPQFEARVREDTLEVPGHRVHRRGVARRGDGADEDGGRADTGRRAAPRCRGMTAWESGSRRCAWRGCRSRRRRRSRAWWPRRWRRC